MGAMKRLWEDELATTADIVRRVAEMTDGVECEEVSPGVFAPKVYPCGEAHRNGEYCSVCLAECGSL
jgi:hypothetical protein